MTFPVQENLEVDTTGATFKVRCTQCLHVYCDFGDDWRNTALVTYSAATKATPLMKDFADRLLMEQLFCPSCGALLETKMVETRRPDREQA
jgi:acetone carboxylase gamma subunit